ncbi:MAG: thioesterase family protein [Firmicutes bacterium]|nr:thioesterase family protein [[Eubacterium] siraeum]MCM1487518.1 thioesterase family protein [Bacillota bacterium]
MESGTKAIQKITVEEKDTAIAYGSGTLPVFATPAMIALMENTAMNVVSAELAEGEATVGTLINVKHLSATPVGCTVDCEAELTEIDGRRLVFKVTASDSKGLIGEGVHERFIVKTEKFLAKAQDKLS